MSNGIREMTPEEHSQYLSFVMQTKLNAINNLSGEDTSMEEWKKLYNSQMEHVNEVYPNKFTKSVWEKNYSKFYNPNNLRILSKLHTGSIESLRWSKESDAFMSIIDQYRPIVIVADHDPEEILQILPPIFRSPQHLTSNDTRASSIPEEDGSYMTNKELIALAGDYFDQQSASDNIVQKRQARLLMHQCLQSVQDKTEHLNDVRHTNAIINEFNRRRKLMNSTSSTGDSIPDVIDDNNERSIEDLGVTFED